MSGSQVAVGPNRVAPARSRSAAVVYLSAPGSFYDSITIGGVVAATMIAADFSVRLLSSRVALLSEATAVTQAPDNDGNNVRYDWQPSDMATLGEGDFMAWWGFTTSDYSGRRETPEFPIVITDHGPGVGTETGAIVDGVAAYMPVSLSALRKDERYGDRWLQQQAEVVKWRTLGQSVAADAEESSYHIVLLDYLSKRLALGLTKPAIEYWSRQQKTRTSTQTSEVSSYPDMIASLEKLASRLVPELSAEWRDLLLIVPGLPQRRVMALPATTFSDQTNPANLRVTPNPQATEDLMTGLQWALQFSVLPFP